MVNTRSGIFEFRGQDAPIIGADPEVGQPAPESTAHSEGSTVYAAYMPKMGDEPHCRVEEGFYDQH